RGRLLSPLGTELDRPLAPEIRRATLDVLADLPAGAAPDAEDVADAVRYHRPRRAARLRDDLVGWTLREAETLGVTGRGALASYVRPLLGGWPADDVAAALRPALPELLDHVLLQADLTAVAPGPLRPDLARELAATADVESRGGAAVYRFTQASVRRALDSGRTASDLHEFLARLSRTPVPQPLSYLIDDVARRHGMLRVGGVSSFVRCDDDTVLAEITASAQASALGVRRIAPGVLVSTVDPATLLDRLRGMGFMPTPEGPDGTLAITTAEPGRAPAPDASRPVVIDRPPPDEAVVTQAVRALRAGERSAATRPRAAPPGGPPRTDAAHLLGALRRAIERGSTVCIGYVDHDGTASDRVVDPVRLGSGSLVGLDHRSGEVRTFALHRISGAVPVESWAQDTAATID
ncbi:MAG: helicase-associated domain-containing protein, partial [bacterium]